MAVYGNEPAVLHSLNPIEPRSRIGQGSRCSQCMVSHMHILETFPDYASVRLISRARSCVFSYLWYRGPDLNWHARKGHQILFARGSA